MSLLSRPAYFPLLSPVPQPWALDHHRGLHILSFEMFAKLNTLAKKDEAKLVVELVLEHCMSETQLYSYKIKFKNFF